MSDLTDKIIDEAKSWISTPYIHEGRVKGAGVDCAHLLSEVYSAAGAVEKLKIEHYPRDWQFHKDSERYLAYFTDIAIEQPGLAERIPQPADIVMFRFGRTFSHGAIVVKWPLIIHSYVRIGCLMADVSKESWLTQIGESSPDRGRPRPMRVFTLKSLIGE